MRFVSVFDLVSDLSECQLVQVPDAVYHLMRNTELKTCDLSSNVIKKIPPKFAMKFSLITGDFWAIKYFNAKTTSDNFWIFGISDLNLSNNQINKLPDELADLAQLLRLDISHNLFLSLPKVVFKMPKLRQLKANNNAIIGKHIWIVEFIPFKIIQPKLSSEINGNHFVTISLHK